LNTYNKLKILGLQRTKYDKNPWEFHLLLNLHSSTKMNKVRKRREILHVKTAEEIDSSKIEVQPEN
jgi:hypothetical protein